MGGDGGSASSISISLRAENIGIFKVYGIQFKDVCSRCVLVYTDYSAAGKTIIAKTINMFATGVPDRSLIMVGAKSAKAVLKLTRVVNGRREETVYEAVLNENGDRVSGSVKPFCSGPVCQYIVFTEHSYLYEYFVSPRPMSLENLSRQLVPEPEELARLRKEIAIMNPPKIRSSLHLLEEYRTQRAMVQARLEEVEAEIKELTKELQSLRERPISEDEVNAFLSLQKQKKLREEYAKKKREVEKKIEEIMRVIEKERPRMEEFTAEKESLINDVNRLESTAKKLQDAVEALKMISDGLARLSNLGDILYEVVLFGSLVDGATIDVWRRDAETSISVLSEKLDKLREELSVKKKRLEEINSRLSAIVALQEKLERLRLEHNNAEKMLAQIDAEIDRLEEKVRATMEKLGVDSKKLARIITRSLREREIMKKLRKLNEERADLRTRLTSIEASIAQLEKKIEAERGIEESIKEKLRRMDALQKQLDAARALVRKEIARAAVEFFHGLKIPGLEPSSLRPRSLKPYTMSAAERMLFAIGIQYAVVRAALKAGMDIPFLVIDMIAPMDYEKEKYVLEKLRDLEIPVIVLKTGSNRSFNLIRA